MKNARARFARSLMVLSLLVPSVTATAQNFTWDGGGGDGNWSTAANWAGTAPGNNFVDDVIFNNAVNLNSNNDLTGGRVTGTRALYFQDGAGAFVLTGNAITAGGNIESRSAANPVVDLNLILNGTRRITERNGGGIIVSGVISETGGSRELQIATVLGAEGNATGVTLSGANTYTGDTRVLFGSTLNLDFDRAGAPVSDIVNSGSRLRLGGGEVIIQGKNGGNTSQTFDGLLLDSQQNSKLRVEQNGAISVNVELGDITRTNNQRSRLDLTLPTLGSIETTTNTVVGDNKLLSSTNGGTTAFATVEGKTWVTLDAPSDTLGALADSSYQVDSFASASGDTDVQNSIGMNTQSANTLRFNAGADVLTLTGSNTLGAGGILVTSAGNNSQIGGAGSLRSGGTELMIINEASTFTVSATVGEANDRLAISGPGTTVLSGANAFTREATVQSGSVLNIRNAAALGTADGSNATSTTVVNGGALQLQGDIAVGNEKLLLQGDGVNSNGTGALRSMSGDNSWGGEIHVQTGDARIEAQSGTFTINGPISSNTDGTRDRSLTLAGGGHVIVNGAIGDLGPGRVIKRESGVATLNGNNTYTGQISSNRFTDVYGGTLRAGHDSAFGTSLVRLYNSDVVVEVADGIVVSNEIRVDNRSNNKVVGLQDGADSGEFAGEIEIRETAAGNFDVSAIGNGILTLSGDISSTGNAGLTKIGDGTVILSGTNTYAGLTRVMDGTLLINGDQSGTTGAIQVDAGATLGGTATLNTNILIPDGAELSPGASPGVQAYGAGLTLAGGSTFTFELVGNSDAPGDRGTVYDGVNVTGGLLDIQDGVNFNLVLDGSLNSGTSAVDFTDPFWDMERQWLLFDLQGGASASVINPATLNLAVSNDGFGNTFPNDAGFGDGFANFFLSQNGAGDVFLNYSAVVPEPSAALLTTLLVGIFSVLRRSRRRLVSDI